MNMALGAGVLEQEIGIMLGYQVNPAQVRHPDKRGYR